MSAVKHGLPWKHAVAWLQIAASVFQRERAGSVRLPVFA